MATIVEIAAQLVSSHAASTPMTSDELLAEITKVHAALKCLESCQSVTGAGTEEIKPTLTLKEAFKKNEIVCLICGKGGFKTLARHLSIAHDMKPGAYKKQFGIPSKQVLAAKSYSEARRKGALEGGLADNLAKAREVRMGNIEAKKVAPVKAVKRGRPANAGKAAKALAEVAAPIVVAKVAKVAKAPAKAPAKVALATGQPIIELIKRR